MVATKIPGILTHAQRKAIEVYLISLCREEPLEVLRIVRDEAKSLSMFSEERKFSNAISKLNEKND